MVASSATPSLFHSISLVMNYQLRFGNRQVAARAEVPVSGSGRRRRDGAGQGRIITLTRVSAASGHIEISYAAGPVSVGLNVRRPASDHLVTGTGTDVPG
jgi:hypothetical protein